VKYTYHIAMGGSDYTEVFPTNRPKTSMAKYGTEVFSREELDMFRLNKSENSGIFPTIETWWGDSTYHGSDMFFEVYRGPRTGTAYYKGILGVAEGMMDKDRGVYEFKPRTNDNYRTILDNYETEYHTASMAGDLEYRDVQDVDFQDGLPNGGAGSQLDTFGWSDPDITFVKSSTGAEKGCQSTDTLTLATAGRAVRLDLEYDENDLGPVYCELRDAAGNLKSNQVSISTGAVVLSPTEAGIFYVCFYANSGDTSNATITINEIAIRRRWTNCGYDLKSLLAAWLDTNIDSGYTSSDIKSTFLFNDAVSSDCPSAIDTYVNANPTHNYVTEAVNTLGDIFFAAKWRLDTESGAEEEFSLSTLMGFLRLLNAFWYVDADGDVRIEHRKWFDLMRENTINLKTYDNGIYLRGSNTFTWEKDKSYHRETWELVESENEDFLGRDITYSTSETYPQTKEHRYTISIDWPYFYENIDSASVSEFMMLHCELDSGYYVIQNTTGVLSGTSVANGYFSLANLHNVYHRYGRMAQSGNLNGSDVTFESWQRFKKQKTIRFLYTSDVNFNDDIETDEGTGWPDKITRHLVTDLVEVELLHDAYAPVVGSALLQETGDYILTEDGYKILL